MKALLTLVLCSLPCLAFCQNEHSAIISQVDSLLEKATNLTNVRKEREALPIFTSALQLTQSKLGKEHLKTAQCLYLLGRCHYLIGDEKVAESYVLESKAIWDKTLPKDHPDQAKSRNLLAVIYSDRSQNEEAAQLYLEARQIWGKSLGPTHENYLAVLVNLGILYVDIGRYEAAASLLHEAKTTFETVLKNLNHRYYLSCINNLGRVYLNLDNYESAEKLYMQVIDHREATDDKKNPTYSAALTNLAILYYEIGQYTKAETYHRRSLAAKKEETRVDLPGIAGAHINLGIRQLAMKKYPEAEVNLLEGKRLFETEIGDTEHPYYASCLDYLGDLLFSKNRIEEAREYYLASGIAREKIFGKEHPDHAYNLERMAILTHATRSYQAAESYYLQALAVQEKYVGGSSLGAANIQHKLSEFYLETNRFDAARQMLLASDATQRKLLTRAIRHLSTHELASFQQLFSENLDYSYSFAQASSNTMPDISTHVYDQTLFYKGFLQTAAQRLRHLSAGHQGAQEKLNILKSYHHQLANAYALPLAERPGVEALEARADELEKELSRSIAGFGEAVRQVSWQEVRSALKPDEVAIEFVHYQFRHPNATDSTLYAALILRPGDQYPRWVPLFEEKQIRGLISRLSNADATSINQLYGTISLYNLIWKPLEKWLAGANQVYYSPSGLLHVLSLEALVPAEKSITLHRVVSTRELTKSHSITPLTSGYAAVYGGIRYDMDSLALKKVNQSLKYEATTPPVPGPITYTSNGRSGIPWRPLPWTEIEVKNVVALLKGVGMQVSDRQGFGATEESVYALCQNNTPQKVLHFSTHGFSFTDPGPIEKERRRMVDLKDPVFKSSENPMMRTGLIMAGANQVWTGGKPLKGLEDGILTAYEISQLNLEGTELVVLSACETGLGKIEGNEGIYGLQRAFKIAGAQYLLMSLWQVPDYQTEALMNAFYTHWLQGKKSIPEAFKSAQQTLRAQHPQPFYWAGFILLE